LDLQRMELLKRFFVVFIATPFLVYGEVGNLFRPANLRMLEETPKRKFTTKTDHELFYQNILYLHLLCVFSGFSAAMNCLKNEKFSEAPAHCTSEIEMSDGKYRLEALLLRGSLHFLCGKKDEALADFDALINDPNASNEVRLRLKRFFDGFLLGG